MWQYFVQCILVAARCVLHALLHLRISSVHVLALFNLKSFIEKYTYAFRIVQREVSNHGNHLADSHHVFIVCKITITTHSNV